MKLELKPSAGDMAIRDLTPKTTNLGERIVKNMRICGSGIYTYAMSEANLLHLTPVPEKHRNLKFINVFRPPEVLKANKDKFARVPIITGHHVLVNRDTAKDLVVGMVGDSVQEEVDPKDGELYLYTTGTIVAGDGVDAYERYGQLSVGYDPVMEWRDGEHNGVPYQAVLTGFNDINHLLICKTARGGPQCMVMDSLDGLSPLERIIAAANSGNGGKKMNLFTKIFGSKKAVVGDEVVVSTLLQSIAAGADATVQIPKVRSLMGDSVDETLKGYLDELETGAKDADKKVLGDAINIVADYCKKLITGDEAQGTDDATKNVKGAGDEDEKTVDVEHEKDGGKEVTVKEDDDGKKKEVKVDHEPDGNKKVEVTKTNGDAVDVDIIAQKVAAILMASQVKVAGDEKPVTGTVVLNGDSQASNGMSSDDIMKLF